MIRRKVNRLSPITIRVSNEIVNFFKYISYREVSSFLRKLINAYFDNKKVEVNQTYVNKFVKMFNMQKCNNIIDDTYYIFNPKDFLFTIYIQPLTQMKIQNICENRNITYTTFIEEIYFNFLKEIALIAINMPKKQRELLRKREVFQTLESKKNYDVKIEDGKYYEQYKMDLG